MTLLLTTGIVALGLISHLADTAQTPTPTVDFSRTSASLTALFILLPFIAGSHVLKALGRLKPS